MRTYLREQRNNHPNASLRRIAKMLCAIELAGSGQLNEAETEYQSLLSTSLTSEERLQYVYALFSLHLFGTANRVRAGEYMQRLRQDWPTDRCTQHAGLLFSLPVIPRSGNGFGKSGDESQSLESPNGFALAQNHPNPFNPTTTIRFHIPNNGFITLKVYDLLGREVATLVNEERVAGSYDEVFDASKLASGVYIYKLQAGNFTASKKLLLLK